MAPHGSSKTVPWAAAFMAGTQAGNFGKHQGEVIDKARLKRLLATGIKLHRSQLPPLPTNKTRLEHYLIADGWKYNFLMLI